MKILFAIGLLAGGYCYLLLHTTDLVVGQAMQIHKTYQYVGDHAPELAGAR